MRGEHIEVLNIKRAAAAGEEVIDLAVIVEEEHAFLRDFLVGEVVGFELDVGWEFGDYCGS